MAAGLYQITNTVNDNFYVGSSIDVYRRWEGHQRQLRKERHGNIHLQRAWLKYGADSFEFRMLCALDATDLFYFENRLLKLVVGSPTCYNMSLCAESPMRGRGAVPEEPKRNPYAGRKYSSETITAIKDLLS